MRLLRVVLILVVALLIACPVMAQEKKKGRKGGPGGFDPLNRLLERLNLTDEQKPKVDAVKKEFAPKLADAQKKAAGIPTDDQKKAAAEAAKEAKSAGKTPRETFQAMEAAMNLSDEQKAKRTEVRKEIEGIQKERLEKIKDILTAEQKEQLDKALEELKKGGKKKRGQ